MKPVSGLKLFVDGMNSDIDTRYMSSLTPAQFNHNPAQNGGKTYTHQHFETRQVRVGFEYEIIKGLSARYAHDRQDKTSSYLGAFGSNTYYDYTSDDASLTYRSTTFDVTGGVQRFQGDVLGSTNRTSKDNTAYYLQGVYRIAQWSLSAGARKEKVEYTYAPNTGAGLQEKDNLSAWDIGANYRLNEQVSLFANYNNAYQSPNIDQFFTTDFITGIKSFNQFINPARSRTVNVGLNHDTSRNKLRAAVFLQQAQERNLS